LASLLLAIVVFGSGSVAGLTIPAHGRTDASGRCRGAGAFHGRTCGADGETQNGTSPRSDAVIEPAGASGAVHELHPAQASATCADGLATHVGRHAFVVAASTFARPHDPRHLHTFSLLI
jgi:hypothetical protein